MRASIAGRHPYIDVILRWHHGGMGIERNWAGNLAYRAASVVHPTSLDEARAALAVGGPVRTLGTRHCFNDIADTAGTQIVLDRMPAVIEVNEARDAVTVSGALRYGDIAPVLEAQGLALANLASLPHISVAGAVTTGTHGSGDAIGTLAGFERTGDGLRLHVRLAGTGGRSWDRAIRADGVVRWVASSTPFARQ